MTLFAAAKTMVGLDWTMVGLFFFVLILIPTLASRKGASSSKEFFLSGRSMPWWLLGISMVAATTSTNSANLFTELIRDKGGISGNWKWWAFLLTGMLTVFVYAKLWRRSGVTTDIEFYELRYSGKPAAFLRCFRGLYLGVLFNLIVMAFVTLGAVKIGVIVFGVDPWLIYVVTTVSAIVYAAFGGLRGMVYTDLFLFALVMVGAVVSMVFALGHVGGLQALVAHAAVAPHLNFFPDFAHADADLLIMIFIIPLAVQWWNVWWPGSEPGGGGYIVQRMLSAKSENHAVGAALFFNVMNYALRPWPWFIVGLASIIVFPQLADIRTAFPNVDPKLVGHDMAYPAMMTVIPSGWYGLTVASLMGALFSTLAAHINMGASYIVNDFYHRFVRPQAGERELVLAGRAASVVLIVTACALAPFMQSARVAMDLTMLIGAGTGPIFLLRWFWMRINAWSEVAGMVSSFLAAAFLLFAWPACGGAPLADWVQLLVVIGFTTVSWLAVTFLTAPTDAGTLARFRETVRAQGRDVGRGVLCMFLASVAIFAFMYAVGAWIYGWWTKAAATTVASAVVFGLLARVLRAPKSRAATRKCVVAGLLLFACSSAWARMDFVAGEAFDLPGTGVARPYAGETSGAVLLAGGANFPDKPLVEGGRKVYHDAILLCDPQEAKPSWRAVGRLPVPRGEGASATTPRGVLCVGGKVGVHGEVATNDCFIMRWDGKSVQYETLPSLPAPVVMPGLAVYEDMAWCTVSNAIWRLDLASGAAWEKDREIEPSEQPVLVYQSQELHYFKGYGKPGEVLEEHLGRTVIGASAVAAGDQHILFFGGANAEVWRARLGPDLPIADYRISDRILVYHIVTDRWFELPGGWARCGAAAVKLSDGRILLAGGELKPGVRSPLSTVGAFRRPKPYSWINVSVIVVYLVGMALMGVYFMRRNKSSDDYFRAGGKLPWWVVSLSIYATMFSSITFISIPAMSYLDDCRYYVISFGIILLAPVVAKWYLPFFRRLNLTSAYEFLEVRFNLACRLFASAAFILFMVARTAVVTYLPAIAIAAVTDLDMNMAIVAVTCVTILYCTIGGVEAVIWSDFVQSIILIASTALILGLLIFGTDGGLVGFVKMGSAANKFRVFDFAFDWAKPCFWVVLIGGLVANLASYTSDQCVVQRYMTTPDEKGAAKSIIFNGVLSFFNCFVFFILGVALWTFYKSNPALLDVTMPKNDSVLPLFMGNDLPLGVSGLVLAAVAAATMSTLSANLNSAASAFTTDFYRRFRTKATDRDLLLCGKVCTVTVGLLGGGFALLLANAEIGNIYDQFQRFLGILTGGLGCLFFMGIFMKRVSGKAALAGLVANYAVCFALDRLSFAGKPHLLLYGFLGMLACLVTALAVSAFYTTRMEKQEKESR